MATEATDVTGRPQTLIRSCRLAVLPVHLQVVPNGSYPSTTLCLLLKFQVHRTFFSADIYSVPQPRLQELWNFIKGKRIHNRQMTAAHKTELHRGDENNSLNFLYSIS